MDDLRDLSEVEVEEVPSSIGVEVPSPAGGIWGHYKKFVYDEGRRTVSKCIKCSEELKFNTIDHSTSSMNWHLKRKHTPEYKLFVEKKAKEAKKSGKTPTPGERKTSGMKAGQTTINQFANRTGAGTAQEWRATDPRYKKAVSALVEFVARDCQPFSVVEDPGFIKYSTHLQPLFRPPCRRSLVDAVGAEYERVLSKMLDHVGAAPYISFTSDIWSDATSNSSFISFTGWLADKCYGAVFLIVLISLTTLAIPLAPPHTIVWGDTIVRLCGVTLP